MTLTASISESHADTVRSFVRIVNHFAVTGEEIAYRATMPVATVVNSVVMSLQGITPERVASLDVIDQLLETWPGNR